MQRVQAGLEQHQQDVGVPCQDQQLPRPVRRGRARHLRQRCQRLWRQGLRVIHGQHGQLRGIGPLLQAAGQQAAILLSRPGSDLEHQAVQRQRAGQWIAGPDHTPRQHRQHPVQHRSAHRTGRAQDDHGPPAGLHERRDARGR